jgi:hypothetical protein
MTASGSRRKVQEDDAGVALILDKATRFSMFLSI